MKQRKIKYTWSFSLFSLSQRGDEANQQEIDATFESIEIIGNVHDEDVPAVFEYQSGKIVIDWEELPM